jgi:hypothetical protein
MIGGVRSLRIQGMRSEAPSKPLADTSLKQGTVLKTGRS